MHAKYRLEKNFLAQLATNFSRHFALNVAILQCEREHHQDPDWTLIGVQHHHMEGRVRFRANQGR
jgi:hypothetical protein